VKLCIRYWGAQSRKDPVLSGVARPLCLLSSSTPSILSIFRGQPPGFQDVCTLPSPRAEQLSRWVERQSSQRDALASGRMPASCAVLPTLLSSWDPDNDSACYLQNHCVGREPRRALGCRISAINMYLCDVQAPSW
jgi:hypothetical protein